MSVPPPHKIEAARNDLAALAALVLAGYSGQELAEAIAAHARRGVGRPSTKDETGIPRKQKEAATVLHRYRNRELTRDEALNRLSDIYPHSADRRNKIIIGSDYLINKAFTALFGAGRIENSAN